MNFKYFRTVIFTFAVVFFVVPIFGSTHINQNSTSNHVSITPVEPTTQSLAKGNANGGLAKIVGFRLANSDGKSRFVFDIAGKSTFQTTVLKDPDRIIIDFAQATLATKLTSPLMLNTVVKDIRNSQNAGKLRLVFELKQVTTFKVFSLNNAGLNADRAGTRLVLDIDGAKTSQKKMDVVVATKALVDKASDAQTEPKDVAPEPSSIAATTVNTAPQNATVVMVNTPKAASSVLLKSSTASDNEEPNIVVKSSDPVESNAVPTVPTDKPRDIVVVIDPGHGGKDPGATGLGGTHEKAVVFAISRDLQTMLNKKFGFRALLTRDGDYFITLRNRLRIAHLDKADIFIAIHADAYNNNYAKGASIFALSERGATSEAARWLADQENESELGQALTDKSNALKSVLIDLAQTATIDTSVKVGDNILNALSEVAPLHHNGVEQAAFVVLKSPDIPSLLVETGFLSNAEEEYRLRNSAYQQKVAYALAQGITSYFSSHPPPGTYIAVARNRNLASNR